MRSCVADLLGRKKAAALEGIYTAREFWIYAPGLTREDMERLARGHLANGLIETVQIFFVRVFAERTAPFGTVNA